MSKPNITTDDGIVADGHSAKNGRIGIYRDVVSDNGMSWDIDRFSIIVGKEILRSECDTLVVTWCPMMHVSPITTPVP